MVNIYYDIDNIYIYISIIELKNIWKIIINGNGKVEIKGKRWKKILENMKLFFFNFLLDSIKYFENIM